MKINPATRETTSPNGDRIWDYLQTATPEVFGGALARLKFLSEQCRPGTAVLNIGVGDGAFERCALDRGIDVHSLDPSPGAVERLARESGLGAKAKTGYSQNIPWPADSFDAVVASEVLEHLNDSDLRNTIGEIARVLKPNGMFLGTVPANQDLTIQRTVCPECACVFHRWGHLQSFTRERIAQTLALHLTVLEVTACLFDTWRRLNWKGKAGYALRRLLLALGSHGTNEVFFFKSVSKKAFAVESKKRGR